VIDEAALLDGDEKEIEVEARLFVEGSGDVLARDVVSDTAAVSIDVDELDVDEFGELSGSGRLEVESN